MKPTLGQMLEHIDHVVQHNVMQNKQHSVFSEGVD